MNVNSAGGASGASPRDNANSRSPSTFATMDAARTCVSGLGLDDKVQARRRLHGIEAAVAEGSLAASSAPLLREALADHLEQLPMLAITTPAQAQAYLRRHYPNRQGLDELLSRALIAQDGDMSEESARQLAIVVQADYHSPAPTVWPAAGRTDPDQPAAGLILRADGNVVDRQAWAALATAPAAAPLSSPSEHAIRLFMTEYSCLTPEDQHGYVG